MLLYFSQVSIYEIENIAVSLSIAQEIFVYCFQGKYFFSNPNENADRSLVDNYFPQVKNNEWIGTACKCLQLQSTLIVYAGTYNFYNLAADAEACKYFYQKSY